MVPRTQSFLCGQLNQPENPPFPRKWMSHSKGAKPKGLLTLGRSWMELNCALLPLTGCKGLCFWPRWKRGGGREKGGERQKERRKSRENRWGERWRATRERAGRGLREEETREEGELGTGGMRGKGAWNRLEKMVTGHSWGPSGGTQKARALCTTTTTRPRCRLVCVNALI